jgi:two-component system, NarL family, nitrate/nitrite response regulator NarL
MSLDSGVGITSREQCRWCDRAGFCLGGFAADREVAIHRAASVARKTAEGASVILCGDQPIIRSALGLLIGSRSDYRVAIETAICPHALELLVDSGSDVVLLDIDLNDCSEQGLAWLQSLLSAARELPVLILTADPEPEPCRLAFESGARGLILKTRPLEDLFRAIDRIRRGERWLEGPALEKLLSRSSRAARTDPEDTRIAQVTKREREIIQVVASGRTNRQIGQQLFISGATVRHHLSAIFEKLGVSNRGELIVYAFRHRLADRSVLEAAG